MISESSIKQISSVFCGDTAGLYPYKSGSKLVEFFNRYYHTDDKYGQGFPSRWTYVHDKLVDMLNSHKIDSFFDVIISKEYLMRDLALSQVDAVDKAAEILGEFNRIVQQDQYKITGKDGKYHLVKENDDLVFIASGGFANVYRQKSTGLIIKKLKDDYLMDTGIRSRFKREFTITKSLKDAFGIIEVYSFDEGTCSYTMEAAETTLEKYVRDNVLTDAVKTNCIQQILHIMTEVHKRDIVHRDISPNNIFILSGMLKIADFGLGKDLKVFHSHQTLYTNAVGQYYYCAPEQLMNLKDGDKQSDVFSLGRVINYIMTSDPLDTHHLYRSVAEKATNDLAVYRYDDAGHLFSFFEKAVEYRSKQEYTELIDDKIQRKIFDSDVESYIYDLSAEKICVALHSRKIGFSMALLSFMKLNDAHAQYIIQCIDKAYHEVCGRSFEAYDPFASFVYSVLRDNFPFVVKEIAANILRSIAKDVNRFNAQHLVEELIQKGIEPMLEDILNS